MKKILVLFVTCFLVTGNCSLVTAQVKIGGDPETGPVAGAVLDLSSASDGGLLLPRVVLTAENANPFGDGESTELPAGGTIPSMNWDSSDKTIATVSNVGVVTAIAPGTTNITLCLGSVCSWPVAVRVVTCGTP
ncbi:MAG: Ig-like domain-containing protein [Candidatus Symbiothrix sp.]|jgi:hypothetical protein|nr:Ig-like domain-containing protein [Candidatus Symbiothrix sp.]